MRAHGDSLCYLHVGGEARCGHKLPTGRDLAAVGQVVDGVDLVQDVSLQVPDDEFSFIVAARNELARRTDAHPDSVCLVVRREAHGHAEVSQAPVRLLAHLVDLRSRRLKLII